MTLAMRLFIFLYLLTVPLLYGFGQYRNTWVDHYSAGANNQSAGCYVCHANSNGGSPWNAYGWQVRIRVALEGKSLIQAFTEIESLDSDGDGSTNIAEITADSAPGWTSGANNTFYTSSFGVISGQSPPTALVSFLDPYDAWISSYYPGEDDPAIIGKTADPNGDGVENVLAYYFCTDPRSSSSANQLELSYTGALLTVTHQRKAQASPVQSTLSYNTNLSTVWTEITDGVGGVVMSVAAHATTAGLEIVSYEIPTPTDTRYFLRLEVEE